MFNGPVNTRSPFRNICHRRRFLHLATLGSAALFTSPGAFAEALVRTARQGEGPFYPDELPLDTDNDLIRLNDSLTPAVGEIAHLSGTLHDLKGHPMRNHVVMPHRELERKARAVPVERNGRGSERQGRYLASIGAGQPKLYRQSMGRVAFSVDQSVFRPTGDQE